MNQFCGINAILFYSNELFMGLSNGDTNYAVSKSLQLGAFQMVITLASGNLLDNFGRRSLLLVGETFVILALLSGYYMLDFDA